MSLQAPTRRHATVSHDGLIVLAVVVATIALVAVLTTVIGLGPGTGPSLEIAPDPAGLLPF
jgi:hypothetical protein